MAGQYVAAHQIYPPVATTTGYTGNDAAEINVNLFYSQGTISVLTPVFATLRYYDQKVEIPTALTVPCNGTGVLDFTPVRIPTIRAHRRASASPSRAPGV